MSIITTGVAATNGVPGTRQDLRNFLQDRDLTNLYLLGLERLQAVDQQNILSWYQLSGIHGRPYTPYDGVTGNSRFGGYCTHSSILFPTWHRPYLALYEQTLAKHIRDIANEYRDPATKQRYAAKAETFRIPYWDWASEPTLPSIVASQETVQVESPTGTRTIKNPLYSYQFHPIYSDFGDGLRDEKAWESWPQTMRYPTTTTSTARSQPARMNDQLRNNKLTLRDRTYNLLTQATNYAAFSNDGFLGPRTDPRWYDSLESIHGQIHGLTGMNGHMGVVDYAAFDPVFWLHHCNVDRLFAIWQAINPDVFVTPRANDAGTFVTRPGTVENDITPLQPFWAARGRFWTSQTARDTRTFGYTYPELAKWSNLTKEEKRVRLRTEVNNLYGRTAPAAQVRDQVTSAISNITGALSGVFLAKDAGAAGPGPQAQAQAQGQPAQKPLVNVASAKESPAQKLGAAVKSAGARVAAAAAEVPAAITSAHAKKAPAPPVAVQSDSPFDIEGVGQGSGEAKEREQGHKHKDDGGKSKDKHYHEWIANILVEKYAVNSTFLVHVFLGDFNSDPNQWLVEPNLVGTHVVFANNSGTGCARCIEDRERHALVTGTIPLTGALGDRLGSVKDLDPTTIVPYLRQQLHWRLQKHDGTVIERQEVPSLKISVGHAVVTVPESIAEFPTWGSVETDVAVTTGRQGGIDQPL